MLLNTQGVLCLVLLVRILPLTCGKPDFARFFAKRRPASETPKGGSMSKGETSLGRRPLLTQRPAQ